MNLLSALDRARSEARIITRPYLIEERRAYVTYEGPCRPMKMRWLDRPTLSTDWSPSPNELLSDDWMVVTEAWIDSQARPR